MNWFQVKQKWACKVKIGNGAYKTLSSSISASQKGIKWKDEKKSIRKKAEDRIIYRIATEGLEVKGRTVRMFEEVSALYKQNFNFDGSIMNQIEKEFGDRVISEISPLDIRRYHNAILERCSTSTWNRHRNVLNAIFNRAREWGFVTENPVTSVKRYPEQRTKVFLSKIHEEALLREAKREDFYLFAFVEFALKTGRRQSEIIALEWSDIDFGKETIKYQIGKKKGGKETHYRKPPKLVF